MFKTRSLVLAVLVTTVGFLCSTTWAADPVARIDIPFAFSVEGTTMQAGAYELMLTGDDGSSIVLRNTRTGKHLRPSVIASQVDSDLEQPELRFHEVGSERRLAAIQIPGMTGYVLVDPQIQESHDEMYGTR